MNFADVVDIGDQRSVGRFALPIHPLSIGFRDHLAVLLYRDLRLACNDLVIAGLQFRASQHVRAKECDIRLGKRLGFLRGGERCRSRKNQGQSLQTRHLTLYR